MTDKPRFYDATMTVIANDEKQETGRCSRIRP
jgi:hypothetical protein